MWKKEGEFGGARSWVYILLPVDPALRNLSECGRGPSDLKQQILSTPSCSASGLSGSKFSVFPVCREGPGLQGSGFVDVQVQAAS